MLGPSVKNVCRVVNRSSCGSGSIVGIRNGKTLILTNAHVAGSRIGREVQVEVESLNYERITARIIMAAYNDKTLADWAVLETVDEWAKIAPVKLSKDRPTGSHYTKVFHVVNLFWVPTSRQSISRTHLRFGDGVRIRSVDSPDPEYGPTRIIFNTGCSLGLGAVLVRVK